TTYFIVMDADGQHPPRIVSSIFSKLASGYDIVIASRETVEPEWPLLRRGISHLGSILGKVSLAVRGVSVWQHDILSGFFGVRTEFWQEMVEKASGSHFRRAGYKCLFDFLKLIGRDTNIAAVPYIFATRKADSSKICWRICAEYIRAILS
ncbi:MAG TPA: glycosyltransferase, partial [bacterium]|nr:glycosyltransferase [bacterium]